VFAVVGAALLVAAPLAWSASDIMLTASATPTKAVST
jgi:hypothetical protein